MIPETVASQVRLPSAAGSTTWVGCQRVSWTRPATAAEKRSRTAVAGWSEMMS